MLKLFISDIDGCVSEPYQPYDLETLTEVARLANEAGLPGETDRPAFSLCSGRSYAYVEAVTQMLGLKSSVLFESGGGLFDPVEATVVWNPVFTDEVEEQLDAFQRWVMEELMPGTSIMYDHGKHAQRGIVTTDADELAMAVERIRERVAQHHPDLIAFDTPVSVDVVARGITKRQGIEWLCGRYGLSMDEAAFIGDTNGDLPALEAVGAAFAPANAVDEVRRRVANVTDASVARGVLEAYHWCLQANEEEAAGLARSA